MICQNPDCGRPLPPSTRGRRFCGNRCRMAAKRSEAVAEPLRPVWGTVSASLAAALEEQDLCLTLDKARAAMAMRLAQQVDGGSVAAAKELRLLLAELGGVVDDDTLAFWEAIRTPSLPMNGAGGA